MVVAGDCISSRHFSSSMLHYIQHIHALLPEGYQLASPYSCGHIQGSSICHVMPTGHQERYANLSVRCINKVRIAILVVSKHHIANLLLPNLEPQEGSGR